MVHKAVDKEDRPCGIGGVVAAVMHRVDDDRRGMPQLRQGGKQDTVHALAVNDVDAVLPDKGSQFPHIGKIFLCAGRAMEEEYLNLRGECLQQALRIVVIDDAQPDPICRILCQQIAHINELTFYAADVE